MKKYVIRFNIVFHKLKKNLEIKFDIQISESEAIFITLHLLSSKISNIKENNINTEN